MSGSLEGELSLIVMEQHAKWPACANQYQNELPNSLVEAQSEGELAAEFAARVGRRIASVASKGGRFRAAIIATSAALDAVTLKARYQLARAAIQAMGLSGELVLSATLSSDLSLGEVEHDRVRHELFALAGALCDEASGTDISVSVRFPAPSEQSGLRPFVQELTANSGSVASG